MLPARTTLLALSFLALPIHAQSLKLETATPLKAGINHGTIDSFVGSHYWYFMVEPGKFHVVFTWSGPKEMATIPGHPIAGMAFVGNNPTAHLKTMESATNTVWDGSVEKETKVVVEVDPVKSPLVRQTSDYVFNLSGSIGAGTRTGTNKAPIVGTYISKVDGSGATKFLADGTVVASSGAGGKWTLFDADLGIYTVVLEGRRYSLKLVPARGLVSVADQNLAFELLH
jgi:hypothetical protein